MHPAKYHSQRKTSSDLRGKRILHLLPALTRSHSVASRCAGGCCSQESPNRPAITKAAPTRATAKALTLPSAGRKPMISGLTSFAILQATPRSRHQMPSFGSEAGAPRLRRNCCYQGQGRQQRLGSRIRQARPRLEESECHHRLARRRRLC